MQTYRQKDKSQAQTHTIVHTSNSGLNTPVSLSLPPTPADGTCKHKAPDKDTDITLDEDANAISNTKTYGDVSVKALADAHSKINIEGGRRGSNPQAKKLI